MLKNKGYFGERPNIFTFKSKKDTKNKCLIHIKKGDFKKASFVLS